MNRLEDTAMGIGTVVSIITLALGIFAVPTCADSQPSGRVARVGILSAAQPRSTLGADRKCVS